MPFSPGGYGRLSGGREGRRRDSRRTILLNLTYFNLFLALVLIAVGGAGPKYPGHSGTTDNPVSTWVSRANRGSAQLRRATLNGWGHSVDWYSITICRERERGGFTATASTNLSPGFDLLVFVVVFRSQVASFS